MSWQPTAAPETLQRRADVLWRIREFFRTHDFAEVQTPVLSRDTVIDRHIDPIVVPCENLGLAGLEPVPRFLQTSPEFAMKRLLAAGMPRIYQIGPAFRAAERGHAHNPEFTMVEWYRVGDDSRAGIELLAELVSTLAEFGPAQVANPVEVITYQDAFEKHAGCDPLAASHDELSRVGGSRLDIPQDWSADVDDWLNLLFSELVQPKLGCGVPTIVTHYPASQSALARLSENDPRTAERFELFIGGVELANGYHELTDTQELERRNQTVHQQRLDDEKRPLPVQSRLLEAMRAGLPACSGCALGLDRLLMVLLGHSHIDDVLAFPIERS